MDQLSLFNVIDNTPMAPVEVVPAVVRPPAPVVKAKPVTAGSKVMDLVVVLPFKDAAGAERGKFLKIPGVVMGFNPVGMVLVDVGTPGNLYAASPWRVVALNG